jgi:hypothetical protein
MAIGKQLSDGNPDGTSLGQSATDKISLYGVAPAAQRSGASQATSIIGTASLTALSTAQVAYLAEIGNTLTAIGAWKGSA